MNAVSSPNAKVATTPVTINILSPSAPSSSVASKLVGLIVGDQLMMLNISQFIEVNNLNFHELLG